MGRKGGRRRKPGARFASGKLKQPSSGAAPKPQVEPMSGSLWQRIIQHGKKLGLDERLATELGRLNRFGELTEAQTVVGFKIAEIYGRFEGFKRLKRSVRSPSYNATYGEAGIAEELLTTEALEELERRITAATSAFHNLVGVYGLSHHNISVLKIPGEIPPPLRGPVEQLCVEDRCISPALYPDIRTLFDRLAQTWNVRREGRRPLQTPQPQRKVIQQAARIEPGPPRSNADRSAWLLVMRNLRPDLSPEQLENAYDMAVALKQREVFRRSKRDPKHTNIIRLGR